MLNADPMSLVDTRIQLHFAAQTLSAAADALMKHKPDDSHSNLDWDENTNSIFGDLGASIHVPSFELKHDRHALPLSGKTMTEALNWLGTRMRTELTMRDYDMPDHAAANGGMFSPDPEHLNEIAKWFSFGKSAMASFGNLRIWPHHFDLGFMVTLNDGKSIGGGFTIGDSHYAQPYFYVNPYGLEPDEQHPELKIGKRADKWFGAVITSDEFSGSGGLTVATEFLNESIEIYKSLLGVGPIG